MSYKQENKCSAAPEALFSQEQLWASNGSARTNSLFFESARPGDEPLMALQSKTKSGITLRELFVPLVTEDPTETLFAETVFGDVRYWLRLREAPFMKNYLEEWTKEADIKRKSKAFETILSEIKTSGRNAYNAAKYLIEEPWKGTTKAARKSRKETTEAALSPFKEDIDRLKEDGLLQ